MEKNKRKKNELSPHYAAVLIQSRFKAHMISISQAFRALRELKSVKAKHKELKALFNNSSYRRLVASDKEERLKFSEKIIVMLLIVDDIEGVNIEVRAAKRSMLDKLETMLDVQDSVIHEGVNGKFLSLISRMLDIQDSVIEKKLAKGELSA